ncbi:bifunctional tetrahydrofolate synthase/dihydrofolate synthase [Lysobacter sp. H21R4]|uniref:bifunctional tetrahydrofolate synthase/dihydrofolate synthase n=1 Tax=Lysobacter sp. H21R4 TaxID=2781021 RepID=UPI001888159F|nr:bifunctional tetrahydrofolate synthase/dihydrofolate synthase [Lysobacter sp. H21R4]QOY63207.1 bifunctional tetrahydrofolate synthase/dihydrofolate synthase [Lysobacter sp. H21R4]
MNLSQWLDRIEQLHPKSIDMGLERVGEVAGRLGVARPARRVITVGGTNGKGSTVAFIEAIGRAAGWRVGAYTSPHLLAYNERIRIDRVDADDAMIVAAFEAIEAARGDTPLTYFEYGTLAALWLFQRANLDLAVLEVGLGGRLDATNVVDPDVAAITTVDVDHQDYLGEGREAIGHEKAGIARAWKPLVLGDDDPPSSVLRHAYSIAAKTLRIGCDFFVDLPGAASGDPDDPGAIRAGRWHWREVGHRIDLPMPGLVGQMQLRNAAVAIAALRALDKSPPDRAVAQGIADARIRGRLQCFDRDGVEVVVDVGHNPQAAHALADWLAASPVAGRTHAVYAALADKDVAGVVSALATSVDHWHLAGLARHAPRGVFVADFAPRLAGTAAQAGRRHDTVADALDAAVAAASPADRVLVFGSFHTAAEALTLLETAPATPSS